MLLSLSVALVLQLAAAQINVPVYIPSNISESMGNLSPWYSSGSYTPPPSNCSLTQVNLIQRHGSRTPLGDYAGIEQAMADLKTATAFSGDLAFVPDYKLDFSGAYAGELTGFGGLQSQQAGYEFAQRYASLLNQSIPFIRSSSSPRCIASAGNWTEGVAAVNPAWETKSVVVLANGERNNTLDMACENSSDVPYEDAMTQFTNSTFNSTVQRLLAMSPGSQLNAQDVPYLMEICSYDSLVNNYTSPWCSVFNADEWANFEYWWDLSNYYGGSYGVYGGSFAGLGYINELIARLTNQPVKPNTWTNSTLDSNSTYFPLNQPVYADFSHDGDLVSIVTAMGLFQPAQNLSYTTASESFVSSRIVPFSGRLVTELLQCGEGLFVRQLVNDVLQVVPSVNATSAGLVSLNDWIGSQSLATNQAGQAYAYCGAF